MGEVLERFAAERGFIGQHYFSHTGPLNYLIFRRSVKKNYISKLLKTIPAKVARIKGVSVKYYNLHNILYFNYIFR